MEIVLILDNIRSMHNVGSIFRSSDAFGVKEIICAGYTPNPMQPELAKTALGAEMTVPWRKEETAAAIERLRHIGYTIYALETGGTPIRANKTTGKIALILGNETEGIAKDILASVDKVFAIPMQGKKESLNVSVAAGIALYEMTTTNMQTGLNPGVENI